MTPEEFVTETHRLCDIMTPKHLSLAMRNSLAKCAREAARRVKTALPKTKPKLGAPDIRRGIRFKVYRDLTGFSVKTSTNRKTGQGMHRNRFGKLKPVFIWLDEGTEHRTTGKGRRRGRISALGLVDRERQIISRETGLTLKNEWPKQVRATAQKYGYTLI